MTVDATVLVTPRSFGLHDGGLREELEERVTEVRYLPSPGLPSSEAIAALGDVDGWIAGLDRIDSAVIAAGRPRLRVIARYGIGTDHIDLTAAAASDVTVTNTPGANSGAVAELTIGFLLALARSIPDADRQVKAGRLARVQGRSVAGMTLGLVGFGAIGQEVARRAKALGCEILAHDPACDQTAAAEIGVEIVSLAQLLERSSAVSLHVPALPDTVGMVDAEFCRRMRPDSFLINTARGQLLDENALVDALECRHLAGAALDCLVTEPPAPDNPLVAREDVIVTPHIGAHTDAALDAMGRMALDQCLAVLEGSQPAHPVVRHGKVVA